MSDETRQGLEDIAAYGRTWLSAHTQHLMDRHLPPDEHAQALAIVTGTAEAMIARMKSDFLARRT